MGQKLAKKIRDRREIERATDPIVIANRIPSKLRNSETIPWDVDNPEAAEPKLGEQREKIRVLREIKNDPLGRLHGHHQIDDAQYYAGRAFQRDWEIAERGAQAIDPSKEFIDGRQLPEPITERQAAARARLIDLEFILGPRMKSVVYGVLIEGMTIEMLTMRKFSRAGQSWTRYYGTMFRDGLDMLAVEYKLASP